MYDADGNAVLTENEFANDNDFGWEFAIVVSNAEGTLYFAYEIAENGEIKLYLGSDDSGNLIRFAANKTLYFGNGASAVDCFVKEVNVKCMGASVFTSTSATMTAGTVKYSNGAAVSAQSLIPIEA